MRKGKECGTLVLRIPDKKTANSEGKQPCAEDWKGRYKMKEAVLNKMNPKERKILEAELQKVYTKQTHSFRDAGKAVWNTKGIRELLDGCTEYAGCYFKWQYCTIAGI